MWRSHMVIGASTWLALQTLAGPLTGTELNSREQACGAVIAAGGALLCDLDTPDSRLAHSLGPVTGLAARAIGRVFGGHRVGTHSLAFCALVGALSTLALTQREVVRLPGAVTLTAGQLLALLIAYVAAALTVALLTGLRGSRAGLLSAGLVALAASTLAPAGLVSAALTIGCASHLLADVLTPEGIAPLWPFSRRRVSLRVIRRTGDRRETLLVLATALVTLATVGGGDRAALVGSVAGGCTRTGRRGGAGSFGARRLPMDGQAVLSTAHATGPWLRGDQSVPRR